jgi:hypothetical protein
MDDRTGPHPEFIARNRRTGEEAAVETKSRHRPGVLHQPGTLPPAEKLRADVDRLYREALRQDPRDRPFVIFLDVNLPPNTDPGEVAKWQREIVHHWKNNEQQIALLGFTNFAWHYRSDERTPSTGPEHNFSRRQKENRSRTAGEVGEGEGGEAGCLEIVVEIRRGC